MSDIAVRVENLSKLYRIGRRQESYRTLRDTLAKTATGVLGRLRSGRNGSAHRDTIWALKDVSFDIRQGEVVGIIGRNGAGKSTLLKILTRITDPTEGYAELHGRAGALLEVGTGFHPELTGRENIYLNGAILGMHKWEIDRKFDEIVAFSEIEKFLDTPVKRYSSGMYVRLAFAVAAHLEPEILLVDEVLAVGDAAFQKKCLGKMGDVAKQGRTVLFVSHNLAAVQQLCEFSVLLAHGALVSMDKSSLIVDQYLQNSAALARLSLAERRDRQGSGAVRFTSISLENGLGERVSSLVCGQDAIIKLGYENRVHETLRNFHIAIGLDDHTGTRVALLSTELTNEVFDHVEPRAECVEVLIPRVPLSPGKYGFTIYSTVGGVVADWIQDAGSFYVEPGDYYRTGKLPPPTQGSLLMEHHFRLGSGTVE